MLSFRRHRGLRILAAAVGITVLNGCLSETNRYGVSQPYTNAYHEPIEVRMPSNAPTITQQFRRADPLDDDPRWAEHYGTDFHALVGTPVIAAAGGVVTESLFEPAYGNRVVITHPPDANGVVPLTRYMHLKTRSVTKGDVVARGQQVGELGTTGFLSSGFPHLHMELTMGGHNSALYGQDANLFWLDGVGQVTCFRPELNEKPQPRFAITMPLPCM